MAVTSYYTNMGMTSFASRCLDCVPPPVFLLCLYSLHCMSVSHSLPHGDPSDTHHDLLLLSLLLVLWLDSDPLLILLDVAKILAAALQGLHLHFKLSVDSKALLDRLFASIKLVFPAVDNGLPD